MAFFTLAARGRVPALHLLAPTPRGLRRRRAAPACAFATKEDVYLTAFLFANALWALAFWDSGHGSAVERARRAGCGRSGLAPRTTWNPVATGMVIALTSRSVLYTSLLNPPREVERRRRARCATGGASTSSSGSAGRGGTICRSSSSTSRSSSSRRSPRSIDGAVSVRRLAHQAFFLVWAVFSFAIYAWAQEKVPWLLVPFLRAAGDRRRSWFAAARRAAPDPVVAACAAHGLVADRL